MTAVEISICNMIRSGMHTKEIARIRNVSAGTINRHRENIRRKLNITNSDTKPEVAYNYAVSQIREKKYHAAIASLRKVVEERPDMTPAWIALAQSGCGRFQPINMPISRVISVVMAVASSLVTQLTLHPRAPSLP